MSRAESAAATRCALLESAAELLDNGGPDAVTLREVGSRAGVSRSAPYRHFVDKGSLLTAVAAVGWERVGDHMHALQFFNDTATTEKLRAALIVFVTISRRQPHLYRLMFSAPTGDPAAVVEAAQRGCDEFLAVAAPAIGEQNTRRFGAILLTGAHGAAGLGLSGLLRTDKWDTTAEELIDTLVDMVTGDGRA